MSGERADVWQRRFGHLKQDPETGCIEWAGYRRESGYGHGWFGGKKTSAHRGSWVMLHGPIPEGMFVCHRCDNPPCVNPEHLFLGTPKENTQDMHRKGRSMWSDPEARRRRAGVGNPAALLNVDQVRRIRVLLRSGETQESIGRRFGVSQSTVSKIALGKTYVGVGMADHGA